MFAWDWLLARAFKAGITPRAFWRMTFWELSRCFEGYQMRLSEARERKADELALLMQPWCKGLTADEILGRKPKMQTAAEVRAAALKMQNDLDRRAPHVRRRG